MLSTDKTVRIINSIGVAENAKIEGISATAKRLLSAGENISLFDSLSEVYNDFNEEIENGDKMAYIRKIGFTITLPYSLILMFLVKTGADIKTIISQLREEQNIKELVSNGIIKESDIPLLLDKISHLEDCEKIYAGEYFEQEAELGGMSR